MPPASSGAEVTCADSGPDSAAIPIIITQQQAMIGLMEKLLMATFQREE